MSKFKVGDTVLMETDDSVRKGVIDRETPTMWIVGNVRFLKRNDCMPGGDRWHTIRMVEFDRDKWRAQVIKNTRSRLRHYKWQELSDAAIISIWKIIQEEKDHDN